MKSLGAIVDHWALAPVAIFIDFKILDKDDTYAVRAITASTS